ncbi:MAG TPA: hypothetical protein VHA82_03700 [Ramlibacter sp.]|uniref:hypothetical protein n=1 Tax=Ramlibacter sp. TaxID=1917967 RepID=UPI002C953B0D|nr:hypothetical protein [Ramlibacter sp.]HVZ42893.1 hypothetical protein [Ramlibacter sp.]
MRCFPILLAAAAMTLAFEVQADERALDTEVMAAAPPVQRACPGELPSGALCFAGQDGVGSTYWVALPEAWNHDVLVVHTHGGPADTGPARPSRALEDLKRWAVTVKAGYAWAGTTYRRGGYGVTMAAEDAERLRRIFVRFFGTTRRTLLHGNSYGAGVAAKTAELFATVDGRRGPYDGVLLTSGVLGGGVRDYEFRLDLRVVYQFFCRNHPRPDEPAYPLWMGLPKESTLTRAELARRVDECTGVRHPVAERTMAQRSRLAAILDVIRIPEKTLVAHLAWATFLFRDLTQIRLGGRNPWGNVGATYQGSEQDDVLNAGVLRYPADPAAVAQLAADSAPTGRVNVPILTLHAVDDPTAFVEFESAYRAVLERAGTADLLVQTFSDDAEHSYLGDTKYVAEFQALLAWIDQGNKPTPLAVAQRCLGLEPRYGATCRMLPGYFPAPLESRVAPRPR